MSSSFGTFLVNVAKELKHNLLHCVLFYVCSRPIHELLLSNTEIFQKI